MYRRNIKAYSWFLWILAHLHSVRQSWGNVPTKNANYCVFGTLTAELRAPATLWNVLFITYTISRGRLRPPSQLRTTYYLLPTTSSICGCKNQVVLGPLIWGFITLNSNGICHSILFPRSNSVIRILIWKFPLKLQRDTIFTTPQSYIVPKPYGHLRAVHLVATS